MKATFEDWKSKAQEADILAEAQARGAVLRRAGREWIGPCPACGGRDRFSVNPTKQIFNCRGSVGGDVIGLIMHIEGVSFMQAVEALSGEPPPSGKSKPLTPEQIEAARSRRRATELVAAEREQNADRQERENKGAALRIWSQSKPLGFTLAETYLQSRGLGIPDGAPWPSCLRFHPALPYPNAGNLPALVCRVDDVEGELTAVWRIFLKPDGSGKADVENPKLGLGPAGGGAVRIGGASTRVGVAEGVESAIGAWLLTGRKFPVWAALSTSGMSGIELPLQIEHVTVFPDGDKPLRRKGSEYVVSTPAGRKAAQALKQRLVGVEKRRCVIAQEPPQGLDYADMWLTAKREAA
jgi:putative DNA primase/helicase